MENLSPSILESKFNEIIAKVSTVSGGKFNKYVNRIEGFNYSTKYMTDEEFANFENKGYYILKDSNVEKPLNYQA